MEGQRTKNALLFVIAICLVLIVLRIYSSVDLVREARAESAVASYLYGCTAISESNTCTNWSPAMIIPGHGLIVTSR